MPFGGAVSDDFSRRTQDASHRQCESPVPFGGAVSDDGAFGPCHQVKWERHQCLSAERSATTVQQGATFTAPALSPVPFGGAVSDDGQGARREAQRRRLVTSAFRRSGQRRRTKFRAKITAWRYCHQCLSAERSATTRKLDASSLDAVFSVTSAFRRSGQRRLEYEPKLVTKGFVTSAFRRSGQRRLD